MKRKLRCEQSLWRSLGFWALSGVWATQVQAGSEEVLLSCKPGPDGIGWRCAEVRATPGAASAEGAEPRPLVAESAARVSHTFPAAGSSLSAEGSSLSAEGSSLPAQGSRSKPFPIRSAAEVLAEMAVQGRSGQAAPSPAASPEPSSASSSEPVASSAEKSIAAKASATEGRAAASSPPEPEPQQRYTLQLAACMASDCQQELRRLGVPEARAFRLRQGEKRWSVVLAGKFATIKEAQGIAERLIAHYRLKQKPWVRSLKTIGKLLES